jgi:UTP:GlnB (protein PII) uridylyltransferase
VLETLEPFLKQAEATGKLKPAAIAEGLKTLREQIYQDFDRGVPAEQLIRGTSRSVDRVLEFCFLHFIGEQDSCNCCLVAVGGYGRSELLPETRQSTTAADLVIPDVPVGYRARGRS